METLIIYSAIIASCSFTISVTSIFKPFRDLISKIHPKIEELIHCPYCLSHYIAMLILLITDWAFLFTKSSILNFIFTLLSITGVVALMHYIILRAYSPVMESEMRRKMGKKKE